MLKENLIQYSGERVNYLRSINEILNNANSVKLELKCWQEEEMIEKVFVQNDGVREVQEFGDYYKFYLNTPMLIGKREWKIMQTYWNQSKACYYASIKKMLKIEES